MTEKLYQMQLFLKTHNSYQKNLKLKFPKYRQTESKDCGPTCIKIIAKYYGKIINTQQIRKLSETTREGSSLLGISEAAEQIGFRSLGIKLTYNKLKVTIPNF